MDATKQDFLHLLKQCNGLAEAMEQADISKDTLRKWIAYDPDFLHELNDAEADHTVDPDTAQDFQP